MKTDSQYTMGVCSLFLGLLVVVFVGRSDGQGDAALTFVIYEELPPDQFVGDILQGALAEGLLDSATAGNLQFSLLKQGSEDYVDSFKLVGEGNKDLRTAKKIDREAAEVGCAQKDACLLELDIGAYAPDTNYFKVLKVQVDILDQNDETPFFLEKTVRISIPESTGVGTSLAVPSAEDLDSPANGIEEYLINQGYPQFEFIPENKNGAWNIRLVLQEVLDREQRDFYQVIIAAKDGRHTGYLTVNITVLDVNDNPPVFTQQEYPVSVPENTGIGVSILQVTANDKDMGANGKVVYGFDSKTVHTYGDLFRINNATGEITVQGVLDYEKLPECVLQVTVRDNSAETLSATAKVLVTVRDVNDNAPHIAVNSPVAPGKVAVSEAKDTGSLVAYVVVSDPDTGAGGQFTCAHQSASFELSPVPGAKGTYSLVTTEKLDRETGAAYDLDIVCRDKGNPVKSSTETVHVIVEDVNDNAPVFSEPQYEITLPERNQAGTFLLKVDATDPDDGPNGDILFSLLGDQNGYLEIDPVTGKIYARIRFDYEQMHSFIVRVQARDQGQSPQVNSVKLHIRISDQNDEAPTFVGLPYEFKLRENLENGSAVGQVFAEDNDGEEFNKFRFVVSPSSPNKDTFSVDRQTGIVFATEAVDREVDAELKLVVDVVDDADSKLRESAQITVKVVDENDNSPVITFPNRTFSLVQISSKQPVGSAVTTILASDMDEAGTNNAKLTFAIKEGNSEGFFRLNHTSGVLSVGTTLEQIKVKEFSLDIRVNDHGKEARFTEATLRVVVDRSIPYLMAPNEGQTRNADDSTIVGTNLTIVIVVSVLSAVAIVVLSIVIAVLVRNERLKRKRKYLATMLSHQRVYMANESKAPAVNMRNENDYVSAKDNKAFQDDYLKGHQNNLDTDSPKYTLGTPQSSGPIDPMEWTRHYLLYQRPSNEQHSPTQPPPEECESVQSNTSNTDSGRGSNEDINSRQGSVDTDPSLQSWASHSHGPQLQARRMPSPIVEEDVFSKQLNNHRPHGTGPSSNGYSNNNIPAAAGNRAIPSISGKLHPVAGVHGAGLYPNPAQLPGAHGQEPQRTRHWSGGNHPGGPPGSSAQRRSDSLKFHDGLVNLNSSNV